MRTLSLSSSLGRVRLLRVLRAAVLPLLLASCGGGGGDPGPASTAPAPATVTTIVVSAVDPVIVVGQTRQLTVEARDQNGRAMTGVAFAWASSDGAVATVTAGVATGVSAGTASITAASGGVTSPAIAVSVVAAAPVSRVVVDKASVFFAAAGQTARLSAQVTDAQGALAPAGVVWTSSAPDKVSVDASGQLLALAIGSAQVFAQVGTVRSAPTLVFVAEPQPGATLVADAQVLAVGPFLGLAADAAPGIGTQYDVTLAAGTATPLPGSVLLAAETAPIAGKVVATRQDAAGLVVTLALAPLHQIFRAYDIDLKIDLSAFAFEALPPRSAQDAPSARSTSLAARWNAERDPRRHALATARPLNVLAPFKAFDCETKLEPKLAGKPVSLTLDNKLNLVVQDRPGYSKHALEGSASLVGKAGLMLKVGVEASGVCTVQAQLKLPIGAISLLVMPAVRMGLGAELEAKLLLVQGELGVEGEIGFSPVLGYECGGATPTCRGLDQVTTVNKFKTKMKFPTEYGMQAKGSVHFYVLAGLDAAIALGTLNAAIVEARIGPKQSFDLAFVESQATRTDYASDYDLKIEGVVEPGAALKKAIELVIGDDTTELAFKAEVGTELWQSPKGNLAVSTTKARLNEAVDFKVSFTPPESVTYAVVGYNVTGVALYRRAEGEVNFTHWKAMELIGSHEAIYRWVPGPADAGKYEFAAFVNTEILASLLEIEVDKDTIRSVEVSCFGATAQSQTGPTRVRALAAGAQPSSATVLASTCADSWVGTTATGNGAYGPNLTEASLTLRRAPWIDTGSPTIVAYYAEGTVKVKHNDVEGCTTTPTEFTFGATTGREGGNGQESNQWFVDYSTSPPTVHGGGEVGATLTTACRTHTTVWSTAFSFGHVPSGTPLSADGLGFSGSNPPFWSFDFKRP